MAEEHKVTLKAVLDTTDIKQQLAGLQDQNTSSLGNAVSSLEKAAKALNDAATAAKSAALDFKDAKSMIKAVAGGFGAKIVGNAIGGTAGKIVGSIGQGATAGAAFGPGGMAIGAVLGGFSEAISLMTESIQKKKDELAQAFEDAAAALIKTSEKLLTLLEWRQNREYKQFVESASQRELEDHLAQVKNRREQLEARMGTASEIASKQWLVNAAASLKDKTNGLRDIIRITQASNIQEMFGDRMTIADEMASKQPLNVMQQEYDEAKKYLEKLEKQKAEIVELEKQEALLQSEIEKREAKKTKELEELNKLNSKMIEDAKHRANIYKEVDEENAKAVKKAAAETERAKKEQFDTLDDQMEKDLANLPNLMQNIGDMTSIQKYGFGMGEVEDSAILIAQMQLDMQTQIRNSVEQIKNNIAGGNNQTAVAG